MKNSFMKAIVVLIMSGLVLTVICCSNKPSTKDKTGISKTDQALMQGNYIFKDKTLQTIYTLQNQRNSNALFPYLKDANPLYRKMAAIAFASIQDSAAVKPLSLLLSDSDVSVRQAAAYALGQVGDKNAEPILIDAFEKEENQSVKKDILESIGKCGTEKGLDFLLALNINKTHLELFTGQAYGFYRFSLRKITSPQGTARVVELLNKDFNSETRLIAAHYLARNRTLDLKPHANQILQAFNNETDTNVRMAIVAGMNSAATPEILVLLKSVINGDSDYRIKVNAIRSLAGFKYKEVREIVLGLLSHTNANISVAAAEFLQANGNKTDVQAYFNTAKKLTHGRTRATLLAAALTFSCKKDEQQESQKNTSKGQPPFGKQSKAIRDFIYNAYKESGDIYEKAQLLAALGEGDPVDYQFIETQAFENKGNIIGSNGMQALVQLSRTSEEDELKSIYAGIFKKGIQSGDSAMIWLAAGILRDPSMNYKTILKDTSFLTTALEKCKIPEDIEGVLELKKTIAFFNNKTDTKTDGKEEKTESLPEEASLLKNQPIDWKAVAAISPNLKITIKTEKGNITLQLLVNHAPGSVANFLRLVKEDYYKKSVFHRVVPNFVIQDGCPRGDGSGGPSYTIGSELGPLHYREGSVGMASAGKDTEGSQWFITHSPTPHLDGRYTIFGNVVSGMEVVHKIEVGDRVLGFTIENE